MDCLRGELASLYKKQLLKLDQAECCGKDTSQMRIQLLEAYVKDLNEQNEMLVCMVKEMTSLNEEREHDNCIQNDRLQKVIASLQCDVQRHMEVNTGLNLEMCNMKIQTDHLEKEVCHLQQQVCTLETSNCDLKGQAEQLDCLLSQANEEVERLANNLNNCTSQLDRTQQELDNVFTELTTARQDVEDLAGNLQATKEVVRQLEDNLDACEKEIRDSNEAMANMENEIRRLTEDLDSSNRDLENTIHRLDDATLQIEELEGKLKQSVAKVHSLESQLKELEMDFEDFRQLHAHNNEEFDDTLTSARKSMVIIAQGEAELEMKDEELVRLNKQLCDLMDNVARLNDENDYLTEEVKQKEANIIDLEEEAKRKGAAIRDLESVIGERDAALVNMETDLSQLRGDYEIARRNLEDLEKIVNDKNNEIEMLMKTLGRMEMENKDQYEKLQKLTAELRDLEACAAQREMESNQMRDDVANLKRDLTEACKMYNDLVKCNDHLECEIQNLRCGNGSRDKEICELQGTIQLLMDEKNSLCCENQKLEMKLNSLCRHC